ncbi:GIY-YIG nuclease family protein [Paenibacillus sp. TAF43_2]|uniref:GIY-YIG nuclease family protein n=1 Tax=Paenibacillus sp. TAF43_2 TaxID=3233069 RepID=UPI003F9B6A3E
MSNPKVDITLTNFIYGNSAPVSFTIHTLGGPHKCDFLDKPNHPSRNGVYVIFSPDRRTFDKTGTRCIYVGEGNIKNRLSDHRRKKRFGDQEINFIVIYYEIDDQIDRKAVERMLIKYYEPMFNKEGTNNLVQITKQPEFNATLLKTIKEVEDIFKEVIRSNGILYDNQFDYAGVVVNALQWYTIDEIYNEVIGTTSIEQKAIFLEMEE